MSRQDMNDIVRGKFDLDVVGHYARPDVFRLTGETNLVYKLGMVLILLVSKHSWQPVSCYQYHEAGAWEAGGAGSACRTYILLLPTVMGLSQRLSWVIRVNWFSYSLPAFS